MGRRAYTTESTATHRETNDPTAAEAGEFSRRQLLLAVGATGAALAGAAPAAGATSDRDTASDDDRYHLCTDGSEDVPEAFSTVDVRGAEVETRSVPEDDQEVLLYLHGWLEADAGGEKQGYRLQRALERHGYDHPVVAGLWLPDDVSWSESEDIGEAAAADFAAWIDDYLDRHPETTFRLIGHSLGGYTALATLDALGRRQVFESVSLLGAAVSAEAVCADGDFHRGIETAATVVYNYFSGDDNVACFVYRTIESATSIGCVGNGCGTERDDSPPENYEDVDVTDEVDGHCAYVRTNGEGIVAQLVENFDRDVARSAGNGFGVLGFGDGPYGGVP